MAFKVQPRAFRLKVDTGLRNSAVAGGQPKAQTKNLGCWWAT